MPRTKKRTCEVCGISIEHLRPQAKTCSTTCRVKRSESVKSVGDSKHETVGENGKTVANTFKASDSRFLDPTRFHRGQVEAWESQSRVTSIAAGTGGGKTSFAFWWLYREMKKSPGHSHFFGLPNAQMVTRILLTSPDPDRPTLMEFLAAQGINPKLHKTEQFIETDLGTIYFATWEAWVNVVGLHIQSAVLDEVFEMPDAQLYRIALERTNFTGGRILLCGTPRNFKWFNEEILPHVEAGDREFVHHITFASDSNPKYDAKSLARMKRILPLWQFNREYGGLMSAKEGSGLFHSEWFIETPEHVWPSDFDEVVVVADTAFSTKSKADYSVLGTWGLHSYRPYLIDVTRGKWEFNQLVEVAEKIYRRYLPHQMLIEVKGSGISLYQSLKQKGRPVISKNPTTDKYSRASNVVEILANHGVMVPEGAEWLRAYLDELVEFPEGGHDDQVDITSMALDYFRGRILRGGQSQIISQSKKSLWTGKGSDIGGHYTWEIDGRGDERAVQLRDLNQRKDSSKKVISGRISARSRRPWHE